MKPPYRLRTHEEDKLAPYYIKLHTNVLAIASDSVLQHKPLNPQHPYLLPTARARFDDVSETINIDGWRTTAPFFIALV